MQYKMVFLSFKSNSSAVAAFKLTVVWLVGLALGAYVAGEAAPALDVYFLTGSKEITFFGITLALMIPLLVSVCLGQMFSNNVILIVVFLKAVAFSLIGVACVFCWGSAGWLVSRLLLFTDILFMPVLLWVWHHILCKKLHSTEVLIAVLVAATISIVDYYVISPFLCSLL